MAYALKIGGRLVPLTRYIDAATLVAGERSTIVFENEPAIRDRVFALFATNHSPESQASCLSDLLCCLPRVEAPAALGYENVFRVLIVQFMDAHSLDIRALKKSCIHIAQPDGRLIPFESFNLFYRDRRAGLLATIRDELSTSFRHRTGAAAVRVHAHRFDVRVSYPHPATRRRPAQEARSLPGHATHSRRRRTTVSDAG